MDRLAWPYGSYVRGVPISAFAQYGFRARNDDGTLVTASWIAGANESWSQALDTRFRIRFVMQEIAGVVKPEPSPRWQLQRRVNGGAWANVDAASTAVRTSLSGFVADGTRTNEILFLGYGDYRQGEFDEGNGRTGGWSGNYYMGGDHSEEEYSIILRSVDITLADLVELRITAEGVPVAVYSHNVAING